MKRTGRFFCAFLCVSIGIVVIWASAISKKFQLFDVFYLMLFIVCLDVCLLMSLFIGNKEKEKESIDGVIGQSFYLKSIWLVSTIVWMLVGFWMISSSLLSTLIVIYISSDVSNGVDTNRIIFYSIASLFVSVMNYALAPMAMSKGYRKAYQEINTAILKYECIEKDKKVLAEAIIKGEEYIEKYSFEIKA